jgi:REP element-mobilizing transposase RayT
MARPRRTDLPDGYFHAYSRGAGPIVIYRDDDDYRLFRRMVILIAHKFAWRVLAYCLMPTHYHIVLEASVTNLSRGMHRLNGRYARAFNERHERSGALFQGRFHVRVIQSEEHLQRLGDYVPDNPVRSGYCEKREDWRWSWSSWEIEPRDAA